MGMNNITELNITHKQLYIDVRNLNSATHIQVHPHTCMVQCHKTLDTLVYAPVTTLMLSTSSQEQTTSKKSE